MLNVILIDDEEPVLDLMERLLKSIGNIEIVGKFTRPKEAISRIQTEQVDVVFLDIQMPGMNGIEAAEYLLEVSPAIDIVFVTAHNEYAVEAFEVSAVDYLLKPPTISRLDKTIKRLLQNREVKNVEGLQVKKQSDGVQIGEGNTTKVVEDVKLGPGFYCFGNFEWMVDLQAGEMVKWRRLKDRELMAYLVHRRNQYVSKGSLLNDLWPNANPEQATAFMHTCVYNIRKKMSSIGCKEKLEYRDNGYRLKLLEMWCDVDEFEQIDSGMEVDANNIDLCEAFAALYKGDYMEEEGFIWAYEAEAKLKDTYISLMNRMADYYSSIGNDKSAMNCMLHAYKRDPFHDRINESILIGYARMGDRHTMIRHYEQMKRLMKEELGIEPTEIMVQLYERLCSGSA